MKTVEIIEEKVFSEVEAADELNVLCCDLCGNPSRSGTACNACLIGLIDLGLATGEDLPEDAVTGTRADGSKSGHSAAWHYKHYDVLMRDNGSHWELGRGAMGITYKAFDTNLHAPVALKIINSALTDDPKARERFLREARAAARLRHPNVATVLHLGWDGDACFYAMEFIEGETLEAFVARQGPLQTAQALEIAMQTARALGAAQSEGLVHRDIKPANIMLARHKGEEDDEGVHVKVIDFGLAKSATEAACEHFNWDFPYFAGTPHYASPEQIAADEVDGRSDIYSLGITLWYMLAGAVPLRDFAALASGKSGRPTLPFTPLIQYPKCVRELLDRMLALDKAQRPQNAAELLAAIDKCKAAISPASRTGFSRWRWAAVLAFLLALTGGSVYAVWRAKHPATQIPSIAVMPFSAVGGNAQDQEFSRDATKDLMAELSKNNAIKVIPLHAQMRPNGDKWPGKDVNVPKQATWLLKESVWRENGKLRISARLFDVPTKRSVWGEFFDYDAQSGDRDKIRAHLVKSLSKSLQASHLPKSANAAATPRDPPQADENYRLGQEQARKLTLEGITLALEYYNRALDLAPESARVHAAISEIYFQQFARYGYPATQLDLAMQSANKAIELAPDDPSGYTALSLIYSLKGPLSKALEASRKAIDVSPGYSPAMRDFGVFWLMLGKPEKGLPWLHASTRLAPQNAADWFSLGEAYVDLDDIPQARKCYTKALAVDSGWLAARWGMASTLMLDGQLDQARRECAGGLMVQPDNISGLSLAASLEFYAGDYAKAEPIYRRLIRVKRPGYVTLPGGLRYLSVLGFIRTQLGDKAEGQALMREGELADENTPTDGFQRFFDLAAIRASQGKPDEALTLLRQSIAMGWVDYRAIRRDPRFAPLRQNPEFFQLTDALREKMARVRAETLAAISKPLKLADYPIPSQP